MTINIECRAATPEDESFARAIYFETQRWAVEQQFGWDEEREKQKFAMRYIVDHTQIILVDGKPVGWVQLNEVGDTIELLGLYITAAYQKQGIGTHIVQRVLNRARAEKKAVLFSVARVNPTKKLFERFGFYTTHEEDHKYHLRYDVAS